MNYIYIDTKTGDYGILHSRGKVAEISNNRVKSNTLLNIFFNHKKKTYIDDRHIVLPISELNQLHNDLELVGQIMTMK